MLRCRLVRRAETPWGHSVLHRPEPYTLPAAQGHEKKGKRKAPTPVVAPLERFSEEELQSAQLMLEEEALYVRQAMGHQVLDPVEAATVSHTPHPHPYHHIFPARMSNELLSRPSRPSS